MAPGSYLNSYLYSAPEHLAAILGSAYESVAVLGARDVIGIRR